MAGALAAVVGPASAVAEAPPDSAARAGSPQDGSPKAVFHAYERLAEAGDLDGLRPLASPTIARPPFARCAAELSDHDCFLSYVEQTVFRQHSRLSTTALEQKGDTVYARLELRNDLTKAAGVDRIVGVDRVMVEDGLITDFAFLRDEKDVQTMRFFRYMASTVRR